MASTSPEAQILSRIKQDHLICQICHCRYRLPKALPCLHTFCAHCLRDFVCSRNYEEQGSFPCPVCRVSVKLPDQGATGFPDNHFIVTLMDTVHINHSNDSGASSSPGSLYPNLENLLSDNGLESSKGASGFFENTTPGICRGPKAPPKPRRLAPPRSTPPSRGNAAARPSPPTRGSAPARSSPPSRPGAPPQQGPNRSPRGQPILTQLSAQSNQSQTPTTILPNKCTVPVQRKLVLSGDAYPIPVVWNMHGAEISFGQYGPGLTEFQKPIGLAVSPEGYIVVGDQRDNRIFIFEQSGKLRTLFTCQGIIQDLSINSRGLIYVANMQAKRSLVTCYNTRGHTVASFGSFFTFEKPHGVAITEDNHMAVTSTDTHQVYLLNEYGKMTHKFVGKGKDGKRLHYPYHVAVTRKSRIVVSDYGNDCIKVFDKMGKCKTQFCKYGLKPGQLNGPRGVCVDHKDNILVADSRNHRVQVFSAKGQFLCVAMEISREEAGFGACPMNVAVTTDSKLVVLFSGGSFAQVRVYSYIT